MAKLKPCPFCGNRDVTLWPMDTDTEFPWHSPYCEICGATIMETVTGKNTKAQIKAWNKRRPKDA
jgi:Lar family restriction alleviation protein